MGKLTPKLKAFVREYKANGGNGTQAAIKAGYPEGTARVIASQNLTKLSVKEEIMKQEQKLQEKFEYTMQDMMNEINGVQQKADLEKNRPVELKAIELKGKALGFFVDKSDIRLSQPPIALVEVINKNGEVVNVRDKNTDT